MPSIEFNKNDLMELIGEEMDDELLEEQLTEIGVEVEEIEDDKMEVETTSDRIDLLSVEGIARNLRSYLKKEKGLKKYGIMDEGLKFRDKGVEVRPEVVGAVVKDVELNTAAMKSLIQLQEKLHGTFGRDRKKVSIGVHDIENIKFPLEYRECGPEEISFVPLEKEEEMNLEEILEKHDKGKEYGHIIRDGEKWPIIVDSNEKVLSFPPIINGVTTEVDEETKDVFVDVTGTDRDAIEYALNVIVTTLAERNGEIHEIEIVKPDGSTESYPDLSPNEFSIDLEYVVSTVGIDMDREDLEEYLNKMGHNVVFEKEDIVVKVPSYRADMLHQADLVEDVAMGYGYSNIEPELPNVSTIGEKDSLEEFTDVARELMVGLGYQEIMNPTIRNKKILREYMRSEKDDLIVIKEPVSEKYTEVRDTLLPQLLETLSKNTHNSYPQKIFEAADTIMKDEEKPYRASTDKKISTVHAGKNVGYSKILSELRGLVNGLGKEINVKETDKTFYIDGRCAEIEVDGEKVGHVGEIHPEVLENFELEIPVSGFELSLTLLKEKCQRD